MPNKWTFQIKPIKKLLDKYVGDGKGWIDPFAGESSPAEFTNDLSSDNKAKYHMEAMDFVKLPQWNNLNGCLFDPPYSYRQVSECYQNIGQKATQLDTCTQFYNRVLNPLADIIKPGGIAISCGWNSQGFNKNRGFEIIEILLVCHGGHHNDTIVTVERKVNTSLDAYD